MNKASIFELVPKLSSAKRIPVGQQVAFQRGCFLHKMNFHALEQSYYVPNYTRTDLVDSMLEAMGFRTDFEVISV